MRDSSVIPLTVDRVRRRFKRAAQPCQQPGTALPAMQNRVCPGLHAHPRRSDATARLVRAAGLIDAAIDAPSPQGIGLHGQLGTSAQARRQAEATRQRNASLKSALRTAVKKVKKAIAAGDKASAASTLLDSQAVIDRIADKRIVHKNLASRTKSRLAQAIKAMQ